MDTKSLKLIIYISVFKKFSNYRMKLFSLFSVLGLALGDLKAFIGKQAPDFTAQAVVNGQFEKLSLSDYKGKYVVFFFYPLDFTFVCPTEIIAFRLEKLIENVVA